MVKVVQLVVVYLFVCCYFYTLQLNGGELHYILSNNKKKLNPELLGFQHLILFLTCFFLYTAQISTDPSCCYCKVGLGNSCLPNSRCLSRGLALADDKNVKVPSNSRVHIKSN